MKGFSLNQKEVRSTLYKAKKNVLTTLATLENKETALITVISAENVKKCTVGDMMLVDAKGEILAGNIGNDAMQKKAGEQGKICISRGLSRKVLIMAEDESIEIFVNAFSSQDCLIIAGAGTVALNIYKLARILGYHVIIADNRAEMLTRERFPEADELLLGDIVSNLNLCEITESTNIVIATHNHEFDEKLLQTVVSSPARYIGVLGNSRRIAEYFKRLESLNIPKEHIEKIHSPIGLDLGGKRTAEIALSVIAEIQAVKYQRSGGFLKKLKERDKKNVEDI